MGQLGQAAYNVFKFLLCARCDCLCVCVCVFACLDVFLALLCDIIKHSKNKNAEKGLPAGTFTFVRLPARTEPPTVRIVSLWCAALHVGCRADSFLVYWSGNFTIH